VNVTEFVAEERQQLSVLWDHPTERK